MADSAITLLAIETSCDETGLAVLRKTGDKIEVLSQALASQVDIHALTGGVVPEVAAREHTKVFRPLLQKVLKEANVEIDAIAVTIGPGLMPALAVGTTAAQALAYAWNLPIIPIHHVEGHLYSALLPNPAFPALALIVSGGHTMLIEMKDHLQYQVLGETRDDAAGEAFDKVARLLDLPYPGGPTLSKLAESGDPKAIVFPRPMLDSGDFDFSFSGLKTAVLYALRDNPEITKADVAASFQQAVVDSLTRKTVQAYQKIQSRIVLLAGGVAANSLLRTELKTAIESRGGGLRIAPLSLCGDNAIMIGQVGLLAYEAGRTKNWREIDAKARIHIEAMSSPAHSG